MLALFPCSPTSIPSFLVPPYTLQVPGHVVSPLFGDHEAGASGATTVAEGVPALEECGAFSWEMPELTDLVAGLEVCRANSLCILCLLSLLCLLLLLSS